MIRESSGRVPGGDADVMRTHKLVPSVASWSALLAMANAISYISIHKNLPKLIKNPYFTKYYKFGPKNITDIKIMVKRVTTYLNKIKLNEK